MKLKPISITLQLPWVVSIPKSQVVLVGLLIDQIPAHQNIKRLPGSYHSMTHVLDGLGFPGSQHSCVWLVNLAKPPMPQVFFIVLGLRLDLM
jgi:hypothetical protein